VRFLLAHGYTDIAGIDLVNFDYPERDKIDFLQGDIRDKEALKKSMKDVDVVIHTAAALPLYTPEDIYTTDIVGTRNVLEQAAAYGAKRFIHISSTAVYGVPITIPFLRPIAWKGLARTAKPRSRQRRSVVAFAINSAFPSSAPSHL
jgi:nucleoside-diphosphate-sugar epimerase